MVQEPSDDHAEFPHPPADRPDAIERRGVTGELGTPHARPAAWLWVMVAIFVIGLVVLAVVRMTSEPAERAPRPAEPAGSAQTR